MDHKKVKRAPKKVLDLLKQIPDNKAAIDSIYYDSQLDTANVMINAKKSDRQFPSMIKEEHYTVCREPGGNYVCHFTPPTTKTKKHAEVVADNLVKFLKEKGSDKTLQAIGGNLTTVNTEWKSGCMH